MNALKRIRIMIFCSKNVWNNTSLRHFKKTNHVILDKITSRFGRTSIIGGRSLVLRLSGLLLYENFGGSNSIGVRTSKA
jgi:hypothetical protein